MEITHLEVVPADPAAFPLLAYVRLTFDDCFAIRDVRLIADTQRGVGTFLSMPNRPIKGVCRGCNAKVAETARYCEHCGRRNPCLGPPCASCGQECPAIAERCPGCSAARVASDPRRHYDVVHPTRTPYRDALHAAISRAYRAIPQFQPPDNSHDENAE